MKRKKLRKLVGKNVSVVWYDAVGLTGWMPRSRVAKVKPVRTVSVGTLVHVGKHGMHVAGDRNGLGHYNQVGVIPHGWVGKVTRLR